MSLRVSKLRKRFTAEEGIREVQAIAGVNFEIPSGQFYSLLGPSGCGKSTTLRCIAGLETAEEGEIQIGNAVVFSSAKNISFPTHKRDIGMVFQSYALWPHMTVLENILFPLLYGRKKNRKQKIEAIELAMNALKMVQLDELSNQLAPLLSGGQQQRVSLARALVCQPQVLLLDEPLSNLDAKLREQTRVELKLLLSKIDITVLYVTHDQLEALALSDRIAVMKDGLIVQEGAPQEIYQRPRNAFVASFLGTTNLFSARVIDKKFEGDMALVESSLGPLLCLATNRGITENSQVTVGIRSDAIRLYAEKPDFRENVAQGKIEDLSYVGDYLDTIVAAGRETIRCKVKPDSNLSRAQAVYLHFPPELCLLLTEDRGEVAV